MTGAFAAAPATAGAATAMRERAIPPALAALAAAAVVLSIEPFPVGVFQDDGIYAVLAKSLAEGHGYRYLQMPGTPNATHYPPAYPLVLAALWKLWPAFPANVTLFKFANAAFVALAAALGWRFARRQVRLGPWAAALAVGAFTACAPIVLLSVMVLSEPMFLAALCPVLIAAERAAANGRARDALLAGAAGAGLGLIRTLGAVVVPAAALVLAWRRRWRSAALVMAAGAAVLLPWQLWVAAHAADVAPVFQGKYGSYAGWLADAVRAEGPAWVARVAAFNLSQIAAQGWATVTADPLAPWVRWAATGGMGALFALGWWRLTSRAPVTAWMVALYLAIVVAWPFPPARFTWAIWPLVGITFALACEAIVRWRPERRPARLARSAALAAALLLAAGYARYNILGATRGWWTEVQASVAHRARPLAEWVAANTPGDAVIATDDDVLIYLYTGRQAIPNGTFTPQEHLTRQTPAFATGTLRTILRTFDVDYVLASSDYGTYAARGLLQATPPELRLIGALEMGAVFAPVKGEAHDR